MSTDFLFNYMKDLINWYYESDDEDMEEEGKIWRSSLKGIEFNMHAVKDIDNV